MTSLFTSIIQGDIPANIIYRDDLCIAIDDIHPQAPVHVLIIPIKPILSLAHITLEDKELMGHLLFTAHILAETLALDTGYRVIFNTGIDALQSVMHIHLHLMGGRGFSWPPG